MKTNDIFFSTFIGEYVAILAEYETYEISKVPIELVGYLLDMDADYYFIGEYNAIEISSVVARKKVCYIKIIEDQKDSATQFLEDMPIPEDEQDAN